MVFNPHFADKNSHSNRLTELLGLLGYNRSAQWEVSKDVFPGLQLNFVAAGSTNLAAIL
jgi:hypothetical protein